MGVNYNTSIPLNGLKLYLDGKNTKSYPGSGSIWYDISGNNNNCVWATTPSFSNGEFIFTGSEYGTITNSTSLDFSSEQTLIMILKHSYTSGRKNPWNQAYAGYGTWTHEDGSAFNQYFGDGGADNLPYIGITSPSTPRNVWNIIAATRNTSTHSWYMNGKLSSTTSHSYGVLTTTSANILIGTGYAGYWIGNMSAVLAYTRSLSENEIKLIYSAFRGRYGI